MTTSEIRVERRYRDELLMAALGLENDDIVELIDQWLDRRAPEPLALAA